MDAVVQNANGTLTIPINGVASLFIPTDGLTGYNRANYTGYGNITLLLNNIECTLQTCDLTLAQFDYIPSLGGNVFFAALFGVLLILNVICGFRYKTFGYSIAMALGLMGEIIGYVGRILLNGSPFDPTGNDFLIYLVPLTIAPAFLTAAIYLCLARIVVVYGENISRIPARAYTFIFCCFDFISLILQAAGGGIASGATTQSQVQMGINVMLGGLSFQVFSLVVFMAVCADFAWRVANASGIKLRADTAAKLYETKLFKGFLVGLLVATVFILIRCAYRVAELSGGFHGPLANNEIDFMILEGTMVAVASLCLTLLQPEPCFQGFWDEANFTIFRKGKPKHAIDNVEAGPEKEESI